LFSKSRLSEEELQVVIVSHDEFEPLLLSNRLERLEASAEFLVRLNMRVIEIATDIPSLGAKPFQRVERTWSATGMHENGWHVSHCHEQKAVVRIEVRQAGQELEQ
jgi:hypothetical protein